MYISYLNFIEFIGDNMFEYNLFSLKVYGFVKIKYLDENRLEFKYKRKSLIIKGRNFKVSNLLDKCLEVKGVVEGIEIKYLGDLDD